MKSTPQKRGSRFKANHRSRLYSTLRGVAQSADSPGKTGFLQEGGADSGALGASELPTDPTLAAVIQAWPTLAEPIKAGILAIVKAAALGD
jgi:hypothetical protein